MKIGFIGLGIMGKPMAKNLLKAGYDLVAFDVVKPNLDEVVAAGAEKGSSSADVASKCEIIVTMLPNSPHVKTVCLGENGIIDGAKGRYTGGGYEFHRSPGIPGSWCGPG